MADRQVATGLDMGPIVELEVDKAIIALVTGIRPTTGEYKGYLVDMKAPDGTVFSVNGHKILMDKLKQYWIDDPMPFEICRSGMAGRAVNYEVSRITTTWELLLEDESERDLLNFTCSWIDQQINSMPPRD